MRRIFSKRTWKKQETGSTTTELQTRADADHDGIAVVRNNQCVELSLGWLDRILWQNECGIWVRETREESTMFDLRGKTVDLPSTWMDAEE